MTSPAAGTTRDYLSEVHRRDGFEFELVDTAGIHEAEDDIETQAQTLRSREGSDADLVLLCARTTRDFRENHGRPDDGFNPRLHIRTKCGSRHRFPGFVGHEHALTAARYRRSVGAFEDTIACSRSESDCLPCTARSVNHLKKTLEHLNEACASVGRGELELVALELRGALA